MPAFHGQLEHSLELPAPVETAWAAFASPEVRGRWFRMPGRERTHSLDFEVGGSELAHAVFDNFGTIEVLDWRARYLDIVPLERIVTIGELRLNDRLIIVSLLTLSFSPAAEGSLLNYVEQYTFLDPATPDGRAERAEREGGTRLSLNGLFAVLAPAS
jgi:uncharacterized protein YndB with AHSA1/START domain